MTDLVPMNPAFFEQVLTILREARHRAQTSVNFIMVEAYWRIGQRIVEEEQSGAARADYGQFLIRELSRLLGEEFGQGFSVANLKNFRQFYAVFPEFPKSYAVRSQLSWSHYRQIMRVEDAQARDYYIREAAEQHWSSRQLERNIRSRWYERLLSSSSDAVATENAPRSVGEYIKDPYVLEFLGLPERANEAESQLESALIGKLQQFLLELGKGFSFVGRQFRISSETSHFYIDLVFYNYLLKCFVLIDLKTGKLRAHVRRPETRRRRQPDARHHPLRRQGRHRGALLGAA